MSYRKRYVKSKIHKIKNPKGTLKSIFRRPWFWIIFLFLIVVLSGFCFFLFYPGVQVKNIIVSGNVKVNTQDLQKIASENFDKKLMSFWNINITSRSIFLVNKDKVKRDILGKFPEIEKLTINKNFPQTLNLDVIERKQVGIFCDNADKCFSIDGNGIIFEFLATLPAGAVIVRSRLSPNGEVVDSRFGLLAESEQTMENNEASLGGEAVAQNIMAAIAKIQKSLKDNFQIDLKEALITSPVRMNLTTWENWRIYFDLNASSNIDSQITKLNLLLSSEISAGPEGHPRKNLRYIDLRPKDRAIICDNKTCGG